MFDAVIEAARSMSGHGWLPATAGNMSIADPERAGRYWITASGGDKGSLTAADFLAYDVGMRRVDGGGRKASAETEVHDRLYGALAMRAVLHGHPFYATVCAQRLRETGRLRLSGWELLKALGHWDEDAVVDIPVVRNHGAIPALAEAVAAAADPAVPVVLVAGHGLYAWGPTPFDALRHVEATEYLCRIAWETELAPRLRVQP